MLKSIDKVNLHIWKTAILEEPCQPPLPSQPLTLSAGLCEEEAGRMCFQQIKLETQTHLSVVETKIHTILVGFVFCFLQVLGTKSRASEHARPVLYHWVHPLPLSCTPTHKHNSSMTKWPLRVKKAFLGRKLWEVNHHFQPCTQKIMCSKLPVHIPRICLDLSFTLCWSKGTGHVYKVSGSFLHIPYTKKRVLQSGPSPESNFSIRHEAAAWFGHCWNWEPCSLSTSN